LASVLACQMPYKRGEFLNLMLRSICTTFMWCMEH
jgi:hypothetical protein